MAAQPNVYETLHFDHIRDINTQDEGATYSSLNRKTKTRCIIIVLTTIIVVLAAISVAVGVVLGVVHNRESKDQNICKMLPLTQKGIVANTSQAKHGDVIDVQCSGIKSSLVGPSRITCLSSGTWSSEPSCVPKRCTDFPTPQNAILKEGLNFSEVGENISVVCNEGFDIAGSDTVTCMANETWSAIPTCEPKDCGFPANVTNGIILVTEITTYNSILSIKCNKGFNLSGDDHIVCDKNGEWGKLPSCLPVTCGLPHVPNHGSITHINGTKYKDIVMVKCEDGFALQGGAIMQCSDKGTWKPNSNCTDINECLSTPCMNGATCQNGIGSYSCSCVAGYAGINCQMDINECASFPCKNGATCNDQVNGYTCSCTSNWSGTHCNKGSHYGTEFYIGLFSIWNKDVIIDIASEQQGTFVLSVPYLKMQLNSTVKKGATTLRVENITEYTTFVEKRAIHIQTSVTVAVFVTSGEVWTDTYLALPVTSLETSYKVASTYVNTVYLVIGIKVNSNVTTHFRNQTKMFTLQPFSVGQQTKSMDYTGAHVESDEIIAVISGSLCSSVPYKDGPCDYFVEQMVPVRHWQTSYIVPPVFPKYRFVLKVLSIQNETVCFKNKTNSICKFSSTLPDTEYLMETEPVVVTSAVPVCVVQYGARENYNEINGLMTVIPGIGHYLYKYYFVVPSIYQSYQNYLSIVVLSSQAYDLYLDGSSLSVIKQYDVPDPFSNYTVIIANITVGYHRLWHANRSVMFGATVYGFVYINGGSLSSGYGFPIGFAFTDD